AAPRPRPIPWCWRQARQMRSKRPASASRRPAPRARWPEPHSAVDAEGTEGLTCGVTHADTRRVHMTGYVTEARIELGNSPAFISRIGDHLKLYGAELSRWDNALDASTELWTSSF